MRKMILTVALMIATLGVAQAKTIKNDVKEPITTILNAERIIEQNDSTPHIVVFYDVERIFIKNDSNSLIRIYNEKWDLISTTTQDVDIYLEPGRYYVACSSKIRSKYITQHN